MKTIFAIPATLMLAACAVSVPETDLPTQCIAELAAEGTYLWDPRDPVPTVRPGDDGSQTVANNINACIREKAGA